MKLGYIKTVKIGIYVINRTDSIGYDRGEIKFLDYPIKTLNILLTIQLTFLRFFLIHNNTSTHIPKLFLTATINDIGYATIGSDETIVSTDLQTLKQLCASTLTNTFYLFGA